MKLLQLELDSLFKLPGLAGPFASCVWIKEGISTDGRNRIRCVTGLFQHVDIWMNENMEVNSMEALKTGYSESGVENVGGGEVA